jgi:glutathione S-transferase
LFDFSQEYVEERLLMPKLLVYGIPISTYVRTVRLLLEEVGVEYQIQSIDFFQGENRSAAYLAKNPFAKVPTLAIVENNSAAIDEVLIYETTAITDYLDTVFADGRCSPTDPLLKARMRQIIGIIDNYVNPTAIGVIVWQRLIVPSQGGQTDLVKVNSAIEPVQTAIGAIESLATCNPYLLGNTIGIADFYLMPIFVYLAQTPEFSEIVARSPKLQSWWDRVSQLPIVKKVCA